MRRNRSHQSWNPLFNLLGQEHQRTSPKLWPTLLKFSSRTKTLRKLFPALIQRSSNASFRRERLAKKTSALFSACWSPLAAKTVVRRLLFVHPEPSHSQRRPRQNHPLRERQLPKSRLTKRPRRSLRNLHFQK
uniref:(northern house mosquito) hypothetical protein n=1 Tax=Culex pipiens TaxID=7175 RepID=A0A8D8MV53_CULPI